MGHRNGQPINSNEENGESGQSKSTAQFTKKTTLNGHFIFFSGARSRATK